MINGLGGYGGGPITGGSQSYWVPPADAIPVDYTPEAPVLMFAPLFPVQVLAYDVPPNYRLRVAKVGFGSSSRTALNLIRWSVLVNGVEKAGYHYLPAPIGSISEPSDVFMLVDPDKQLQIVATNYSQGTPSVSVRIVGWLFDPRENRS